jgi:hypothetical protein
MSYIARAPPRRCRGLPTRPLEASANVNEKKLVEPLLDRLLGEDIEVEFVAGDSQFESEQVFDVLNARKIGNIIPWRRLKGRVNPSDVLSLRDRIDVKNPEHLRIVYKTLRAKSGKYSTRLRASEKSEYFFQTDSDKIGRQMSKNFHCARGYVAAKTANKEF